MRNEIRNLPTLSSAERDRIRRSREALVGGGLLDAPPGSTGVPQHIEKSWRRCVGDSVPVAGVEIGYREPGDALSALRRAAGPVLDRLKDSLADVPVAMVLSDATGRIVQRHAALRRQRTVMDRASAAEGFDFSERSIGTNGIGTVLAERRPMLVRGPEHYNVFLERLTCAGTPIVEPYTGRLVGTFSLACSVRDVHPLMTVLAGDIGRQIEERITEDAGDRHRGLVQAYLSLDRAPGAALVVDEETVLANRLGLHHTGPELHALLWPFLDEQGPSRAQKMQIPLADGMHEAIVEPVHDGGRRAYSVRLSPRRPGGTPAGSGATGGVRLPAPAREPLHFHPDVHRQLETAVRHHELVALTGASGTGKLRTALRTLRTQEVEEPLVLEPHLDPGWFDAASAAASAGRGVVIRRIHAAPSPTPAQVQALTASGVPVALTADLDAATDTVLGLVRQVATTVRLPALAQSREHLPALVRAMLAELPEPESATRFSAPAWDRLTAWHWPGNLAELRNTLLVLARRAGGGTVDADDLPDELRSVRRSAGLLESAEREAVAEALRSSGGNRSRAAQALGIGRTTLYRKMREFGLT
ncbi:sigma-54-dependent Fis family transcriptional regulator [Pseudonocardia parietis]|uniref:Transcriptional regulator of acetoin/glycerol metabolism n=1 Tax=Pseudonocardia parietis TaxID=570936 RepID=A0ABS4VKY5_9PSEU|nr:helix-turn-helix domain-containing protein [Pseudonocardia parietis]MBP2364576.1 transcriptional regulator of acetoin/glycerol metabolism [Pseudonocardia parietis]